MDFPLVRFPLWLEECEKLRYFRKITQLEKGESQEQVLAQTVRKVLEFIYFIKLNSLENSHHHFFC